MKRRIEKAVVLGAGTMGARIAAHFANAGLPCILLDIVPPDLPPGAPASERNRIVRAGLESARKSRPAAFFVPSLADSVAIGNFEDDLARCAEAVDANIPYSVRARPKSPDRSSRICIA